MAQPLLYANAGNTVGNQMGSLPLRGLQSGKESSLCGMREGRSVHSTCRVRKDSPSMFTGGLVFSRKTMGLEGGQARWREQLGQLDLKQLGVCKEL